MFYLTMNTFYKACFLLLFCCCFSVCAFVFVFVFGFLLLFFGGRKVEGNVLFNNLLDTFYLQLYDIEPLG